jgi:hypothetical protein
MSEWRVDNMPRASLALMVQTREGYQQGAPQASPGMQEQPPKAATIPAWKSWVRVFQADGLARRTAGRFWLVLNLKTAERLGLDVARVFKRAPTS